MNVKCIWNWADACVWLLASFTGADLKARGAAWRSCSLHQHALFVRVDIYTCLFAVPTSY